MSESDEQVNAHRRELVTAAARLAGRGREARRVVVVLPERPSSDEVYEVRRYLNESHTDVAMSMDGEGTMTFRKAKAAPRGGVVRPARRGSEAVG